MNQHPSMTDREALELARRDFDQHLKDGLNNTQVDMVLKLAEKYMNETDQMRKEIEKTRVEAEAWQIKYLGARKHLEWYGDRENYIPTEKTENGYVGEVQVDKGKRARVYLGQEGVGNQDAALHNVKPRN